MLVYNGLCGYRNQFASFTYLNETFYILISDFTCSDTLINRLSKVLSSIRCNSDLKQLSIFDLEIKNFN